MAAEGVRYRRYSHDSAWYEAWDKNHNAVMTSLNIAKAGDASNEFLEYLRNRN